LIVGKLFEFKLIDEFKLELVVYLGESEGFLVAIIALVSLTVCRIFVVVGKVFVQIKLTFGEPAVFVQHGIGVLVSLGKREDEEG
jgi:hypothetical protein